MDFSVAAHRNARLTLKGSSHLETQIEHVDLAPLLSFAYTLFVIFSICPRDDKASKLPHSSHQRCLGTEVEGRAARTIPRFQKPIS